MAAPSILFSFSGVLRFPPSTGQPDETIGVSLAGQHSHRSEQLLTLSGAGTHSVDLGTIASPGAKLLQVQVDADPEADPINLQFNGGGSTGQMEVSPGGFLVHGSPNPSTGITSIDIVYTTDVTVRLWILG